MSLVDERPDCGSRVTALSGFIAARNGTDGLDSCQAKQASDGSHWISIREIEMKRLMFLRTKIGAALGAVAASLLLASTLPARADDPGSLLKAMTDYLGGQKDLSASFESDIEIITPELQKIQFTSSGQIKLGRPDKLRVRRTGGYADVDLVYDGKTISIYGNDAKSYVQADVPGTVDQMIAGL